MRAIKHLRAYEEPEEAVARPGGSGGGTPKVWCGSETGFEYIHGTEGFDGSVFELELPGYDNSMMMIYFLNAQVTQFNPADSIMDFTVHLGHTSSSIIVKNELWGYGTRKTYSASCLIDPVSSLNVVVGSYSYGLYGSEADVRWDISLQVMQVDGLTAACCYPDS